ncbi:helix-turn-helix transcriptional regulator [Aquabacterium sp.]|uniref:helix-turn-helix transcriptional regulator n=1 Tax=Aquabacterium sp. TaxID=1872578 RepID=UPI0035AE5FFB
MKSFKKQQAPIDLLTLRMRLAATDSSQWQLVVNDLCQAFGSRGGALFTPEPAPDITPVYIAYGDLRAGVDAYFSRWANQDAWNKAAAPGLFSKAGQVRFGHEFLPDDELRATAFFNEWCSRYSAEQLISLKVTDQSDAPVPVVHLTLFRLFSDPPFSRDEQLVLEALWPHLRNAVNRASSLWSMRPKHLDDAAAERTVDSLAVPIWIIQKNGHIQHANTAAHNLMDRNLWARQQHGTLQSVGDINARALKALLAKQASAETSDQTTVTVSAQHNGRLLPGILSIAPLAAMPLFAHAWPQAIALLMLKHTECSSDMNLLHRSWLDHVAHRFSLTPAMREILEQLSQGSTVKQIALQRGVAERTVRAQLVELGKRTGLTRQADFVRLSMCPW